MVTRSELGNKMGTLTRSIQARKDKKYISEPANCSNYKSADSLVQVPEIENRQLVPAEYIKTAFRSKRGTSKTFSASLT